MFAPINIGMLYFVIAIMLVLGLVCIGCVVYGLVNYKTNKGQFCIVVSLAIVGGYFIMTSLP